MDWTKLAQHGVDVVAVVGIVLIVLKLLPMLGKGLVKIESPSDGLNRDVLDALRSNTEAMTRLAALIERQGETMDRMGEALQRQMDMLVKLQVELARGRVAS